LISLSRVLGKKKDTAFRKNPVQAVVFRAHGGPAEGRSVGLVVDEIIDIATDAVAVPASAVKHGVLRSTRIDKKVTDLLDLEALIQACASEVLPDLSQTIEALRATVSQAWEQTDLERHHGDPKHGGPKPVEQEQVEQEEEMELTQ